MDNYHWWLAWQTIKIHWMTAPWQENKVADDDVKYFCGCDCASKMLAQYQSSLDWHFHTAILLEAANE